MRPDRGRFAAVQLKGGRVGDGIENGGVFVIVDEVTSDSCVRGIFDIDYWAIVGNLEDLMPGDVPKKGFSKSRLR